jgi:hypothetical protein
MSHTRRKSSNWYNKPGQKDDFYTGVASFGRIMAVVGAVIATIIGLLMFGFGIHILVSKSNKVKTTGQTITVHCDPWTKYENNSSKLMYKCSLAVKYLVDGKWVHGHLTVDSGTRYTDGENINLYYDKENPSNIGMDGPVPHNVGWLLIVLGILFVAGSWLWVYLTRKYKFAAAMQGADSGLGLLRSW